MSFAAFLILAQAVQDDTGEQFFKFKKDTAWAYEQTRRGETLKVVMKVVKEEGGKVYVDIEEYGKDDKVTRTKNMVFYVEDGYLIWTGAGRSKTPPMRCYKLGSKKGDTWKFDLGTDERKKPAVATHLGTEEVAVPAGTYEDVVHTQVAIAEGTSNTVDFYFAPKVGLVKMTAAGTEKLELKAFAEAK
ncbi:MAG: hypothetical protein HYY17_10300 [Planctomycetes bacterium]|nr:hypothetical protein [Planctomycetota bacterium]